MAPGGERFPGRLRLDKHFAGNNDAGPKANHKEKDMRSLKLLPGLIVAAILCSGNAAAAEPVKIRLAWVVPVSNWATMLVEKMDLARHNGKTYTLEAVRYQGTPPMITALGAGELEIALLAYPTVGLAIQNAGMKDLRIIADEIQDGRPATTATSSWCTKTAR
jgi:NitT/TauT family transport system substrate-binding protein